MAIFSNVDIKKGMRKGIIKIDPKPEYIGPISVDLTLSEVSELKTSTDPIEIYRTLNRHDQLTEIDFSNPQPIQPVDDQWVLKRLHKYLVKYRENVEISTEDLHFNVTMRSTADRQGIHSDLIRITKSPDEQSFPDILSQMGIGSGVHQIISSYISTRVKRGGKISQTSFHEPGTKPLNFRHMLKLTVEDFAFVDDGIKTKSSLVLGDRSKTDKKALYDSKTEGCIGLHLHPIIKYFDDDDSENGKLYDRSLFKDLDLTKETPPTFDGLHSRCFMLGRSDSRIFIGRKYVGVLPMHFPAPPKKPMHWADAYVQYIDLKEQVQATGDITSVHGTSVHCSAPYILPGSEGTVTFEMQPGSVVQPHMFIPLSIHSIKTPGRPYRNRLNRSDDIYLS